MQTPSLLVVLVSFVIASGLTWILAFIIVFLSTSLAQSIGAALLNWFLAPTPIAVTSVLALTAILTLVTTKALAPWEDLASATGTKQQCHILIAIRFFLEELLLEGDV
jgi:hypothetical protein